MLWQGIPQQLIPEKPEILHKTEVAPMSTTSNEFSHEHMETSMNNIKEFAEDGPWECLERAQLGQETLSQPSGKSLAPSKAVGTIGDDLAQHWWTLPPNTSFFARAFRPK